MEGKTSQTLSGSGIFKYSFFYFYHLLSILQRCLDIGALSTATSYLIIIRTLEPCTVSSQLATELLNKSLQMDDFETGKELVRFLNGTLAMEHDNKSYEIF